MTDQTIVSIAARMTGESVVSVDFIEGGRNNRVYRLGTDKGVYALKSYLRQKADPRDRLKAEFDGLRFLKNHGEAAVPAAIACDRAAGLAVYEWLPGEKIDRPGQPEIDAALDFIRRLKSLRGKAAAKTLPLASEACLSAHELIAQISARLSNLARVAQGHKNLRSFLEGDFKPVFSSFEERARRGYAAAGWRLDGDIDIASRTLSPSDFGFHNALKMADGSIKFMDFEYFGWDDPVRLVADFLLHPGMQIDQGLKRLFAERALRIFCDDGNFRPRFSLLYPLVGLRWVLIILNEFLPREQRRRLFAEAADPELAQAGQLAKAGALLGRLNEEETGNPYEHR